jgi:protein-L-isoaspartate O-methyltransferase
METPTNGFDGAAARLVGPVMARMNRDMERAAIEELAPAPDDSVLAIGIGPGVGIAALVPHLPDGVIGGVDPSGAMVAQARRRNLAAIERGQVVVERSPAARSTPRSGKWRASSRRAQPS